MLKKIFTPKNNRAIVCAVYVILILITMLFIFRNSFASMEESAAQSDKIIQIVRPIIDPNKTMNDQQVEHIVRKSAHFVEFGTLGFEFALLAFHISRAVKLRDGIYVAAASLLTANLDELLQIYSQRGSMVSDVFIDFGGALIGIIAGFTVSYLVRATYRAAKVKKASRELAVT